MATKKVVKKKNPRWIAVLEDVWANQPGDNSCGPASKAELLDMLSNLSGFKVVKLTREPVKK